MIDYPNKLNKIINRLNKYGAKPIIVGGYVRDSILNINSKDIDIEIYNISSFKELESILEEFGSVNSVGKSFGVCKLKLDELELDFSLPRTDNKTDNGHRGFDISVDPNLDFKTAASRRDFTINAIGFDAIEKKIIDPFNGISDLKNKVLRAVDRDTFIEDPLRVLRAVQFYARFDLNIDSELFSLCKDMVESNMLDELSKERVFIEIKKLLLKSSKPSSGFLLIKRLGALKYFPELELIPDFTRVDAMAKQLTANESTNIVLMLATLFIDFNTDDKLLSVEKFLTRLTDEKELLHRVISIIKYFHIIHIDNISNYELYKLATHVKIEELLLIDKAVYGQSKRNDTIYDRVKKLNILSDKLPPLLYGRDIISCGVKPSEEFSTILNIAYDNQMREEFKSYEEAMVWLRAFVSVN